MRSLKKEKGFDLFDQQTAILSFVDSLHAYDMNYEKGKKRRIHDDPTEIS